MNAKTNSPLQSLLESHRVLACLRVAALVLLLGCPARAQSPGDLDASFNPGTGADSRVLAIARQVDGKLVVAGQFNLFNGRKLNRITRLNADGSSDFSFNPGNGADSTVNAVVVTADGKILVGGDFYSFDGQSWRRLARLTSSGSPDPTFVIGSGADGSVQAVVVQPDGKVLLAGGFTTVNGTVQNRIARLNADGSVDASFNPGSGVNAPVLTLALQHDGKILLGGYFSAVNGATRHRVARLNSDGSVDTSFVPGTADNGYVNSIALTGDGKVFVAGGVSVGIQSRLIRLLPSGGVDHAFNPGNNAINSDVTSAIAQSDGKVLLAGYFTAINGVTRNGVARMNADGSLDPGFDPGPGANQLVWTMVLQPDGRLVAGGAFTTYGGVSRNRLTRIHNDGAVANQAPQMAATGNLTILEDSGSQNVTITGIAPGPAGETAQAVTNVTAFSSNPALIPSPSVTYTPGTTSATLDFTPAANANGTVTISVVAQDNGGTANGGVDRLTNSFTVAVTPVNDAPLLVMQARPTTVAFFNDTNYVWTSELPSGGALLTNLGVTVVPFTDFASAVGAYPVIVVPSMHTALAPTLNAAARASISNFVHTGGVLVVMGNHVPGVQFADLMNAVFGYSLIPYRLLSPSVQSATATGTPFADDSPWLWANDQESYAFMSLPPNARVIYQRDGVGWDESSVTVFSVGTGQAVTLGGQFSQSFIWSGEGTWLPVLASAITPVQLALAVSEDSGPQTITGFAATSRSGPANESAQLVSFLVANDNPALFSTPPAIAANGTLSFTPAPNATGTATVTVRAQDDGGTVTGGVDTSAPQTFTITITPVNDAPTITLTTNLVTVAEGSGAYSANVFASVAVGPPDEAAGQTLTNVSILSVSNPALFSAGPTLALDGTLTFTPAANPSGSALVTFAAQDNGGTANGGVDGCTNSFTITVLPLNHAPSFGLVGLTGQSGSLAWVRSLAGSGSGFQVAKDANGNAYAAGYVNRASGSGDDFVTVKYLPDGTVAWTNFYNGPGNGTDRAYGLAVDGGGNVYVTGESAGAGSGYDFATLKYLPNGTPAWTNRFDGPSNGHDRARALALDGAGNVYVTGEFITAVAGNNFATLKYLPDGTAVWTNTLNITRSAQDVNNALAVDGAGNVFVSAYPGPSSGNLDWTVAKYLTDGTPVWTNHYGGSAGGYDVVNALAVDAAGNLLVAGVSSDSGTGQNLAVVKYLPDGTPAWTNLYHGSADDVGSALVLDGAGRVFVTGRSQHPTLGWGLVTLGYQADGTPLWTNRYDGTGSGLDMATSIAVDNTGNVFVTGNSAGSGGGQDIVTLKYRPDGVPVWTNLFAGALNQSDNGASITVDAAGRVFVTGVADGQFTTLAYWQPANRTVLEDAGPQSEAAFAINISAGPASEAGQTVSFVVTNDNHALFSAQPTVAANGTLAFTPAPNANGSATITVVAVDDGGAPGVSNSAPQTFTLIVTPVNDSPSFNLSGTNVTVFPGDGGTVARANWATNISAGPPDESGQTVTFITTNSHPALFVDQPVILANGTLEFTPEPTASGVVTVGVRAVDSGGTDNGGVNTSGWQTFTITLAPVKIFVSESPTVIAGTTVEVPISLAGIGNEGGASFTVTYDRSRLTFQSATVDSGSGLTLFWTEPYPDMNKVGVIVTKPAGTSFPAGTNVMVRLTFQAPIGTAPTNTPISFSSATVVQQVSDTNANAVAAVLYVPGSVTILAVPPLEGDVAPRNAGGNGTVTVSDAVQLTRFVAGWDPITDFTANGEFQRADCAPRGSLGDGRVTLIDLVQTLRYAAALDPATPAGGPTMQAAALAASSPRLTAGSRVVRVVGGNLFAGRTNAVSVQLDAQGNEAGVSLSLGFDPTTLTFVSASVGSGAPGASLMVNNAKAAAGRVGLVLVMPAGTGIAAGPRDIITLTFNVANVTGSTAVLVSGDSPVAREIADISASVLGASFVDGNFNLILPPGLTAAGLERAADGSLHLLVVNRDGTPVTAAQAAKYEVHVTSDLGGAWTLLPDALVIENGALKIVDPAASSAGLRLYKLVELP